MKKINELTPTECQTILDELFERLQTKFERLIEEEGEVKGIEYSINYETSVESKKYSLFFNDPDALTKLYEKDVNISSPLKNLKFEYFEMDEMNYIFFDHIMSMGEILVDGKLTSDQKINKIVELRKVLAERI